MTEEEELPRVLVIAVVLGVILAVLLFVVAVVCCCRHRIMQASPVATAMPGRAKQAAKSESE